MKKRTRNKLLAIVTAILLAAIMVVPGIGSLKVKAGKKYDTTQHAGGSEDSTTIKKVFQIKEGCLIPASTFTFKASSGAYVERSATTLEVLAGITPEDIVFTTVDGDTDNGTVDLAYAKQTKAAAVAGGDHVTVVDEYPDPDHFLAIKTVTLNFANVKFEEPGVYRYLITESGSNTGVTNDSEPVRTLDVYVEDATTIDSTSGVETNQLKITGYVLYRGEVTEGPSNATSGTDDSSDTTMEDGTTVTQNSLRVADEVKSVGFTNYYPTAGLTFGKEVTGNQGSRDKYFRYTVTLTGPIGTVLDVDCSQADKTITANPNAATTCITSTVSNNPTLVLAENPNKLGTGIKVADFYLQDGQYITISGFTDGMGYEIKEAKEEYTQAAYIEEDISTHEHNASHDGYDELKSGTVVDPDASSLVIEGTFTKGSDGNVASQYTGFTNSKNGTIPTGVILSVAPWAIAGVVILAGVVFFAIRSRKKYEEE